jgi:hypothetical protein
MAVEEAVREEYEVGGEAVAADVAAFPGAVGVGGGEGCGGGAAVDGAAGVVATVGADQVDGFGAWGAGGGTGEDLE